jgi:hypothetical protein
MGGGFLEGNGTLLLMLAMAAVVIADVIGHALRVHQLGRLRDEEKRLVQLKEDRRRQIETLGVRRESIVAHERIVATLEQRMRWVRDEIDAELGQALTVEHEIGSKARTRSRFRIRLLSTAGDGTRKGASGAEGPLLGNLHPEIARLPNFALVWAGSEREALHRFGVAFPSPVGVTPDAPVNLDRGSGTAAAAAEASEEFGDDGAFDDAPADAAGEDAPLPADVYRETAETAYDAERSLVR